MSAKLHAAFVQGWQDCEAETDGLTPRTVAQDYPKYSAAEVNAYLNGADDCATGDTFRLNFRPK